MLRRVDPPRRSSGRLYAARKRCLRTTPVSSAHHHGCVLVPPTLLTGSGSCVGRCLAFDGFVNLFAMHGPVSWSIDSDSAFFTTNLDNHELDESRLARCRNLDKDLFFTLPC